MPRSGNTTERGYGRQHQSERKKWEARLNDGEHTDCGKCNRRVYASDMWHLGHNDERTEWTGPEHERCNVADGGRRAHEDMIIREW